MDTTAFYSTSAQLAFTVLGFWWLIVEFRHKELTRNADARRFSFLVSLQFTVPGLVALASLIAPGDLWRLSFGIAGVVGLAALAVFSGGVGSRSPFGSLTWVAWLTAPVYVLVTLIAVFPAPVAQIGFDPLQAEGLAMVAILALGVLLAWFLFTAPRPDPEQPTE